MLGIPAPAFEARPVAGGESSRLVEEEQLRVPAAPDVALAALEVEHAANPLPRRPAPPRQPLLVGMNPAAAIAHVEPTRRRREQFAERIDPVLQTERHIKILVIRW